MNIHHPHDKYFKKLFSITDQARSFFENYLPDSISKLLDLASLNIQKDSFVDDDLTDFYSDLLYQINIKSQKGFIYILFDHKSYSDKNVILQLLRYIIMIWEKETKNNPKWEKLPPVIPLIFYHGKEKWNVSDELINQVQIPDEALKPYIPNYKYLLCDLSDYSDDELKGEILLSVSLITFKHIFDKREDLTKVLSNMGSLLSEFEKSGKAVDYLKAFIVYLIGAGDISPDNVRTMLEKNLFEKGKEIFMTAAEELKQEGRKEGKQEGRKEGKQEEKQEIARKMLKEKADIQFIIKVTELSFEEIEQLKQ